MSRFFCRRSYIVSLSGKFEMAGRINTFVYGSLMFDAVWGSLISTQYAKLNARLNGYARRCVRGEVYPGLTEAEDGMVNGILVIGVTTRDVRVLDRFEGGCYSRRPVTVSTAENGLVNAETYVFRPGAGLLLSDREWSVDEFRENGLRIFLRQYQGFQ